MINIKKEFIKLDTNNTTYIIGVTTTNHLSQIYYGDKITIDDDISFLKEKWFYPHGFGVTYDQSVDPGISLDYISLEYPSVGKGDFREAALVISSVDGYTFDFKFDSAKLIDDYKLEGLPTPLKADQNLLVTLKDDIAKVKLELIYSVYEKSDVITRTTRLINESNKEIKIHNIASMSLDMVDEGYELLNYNGGWITEMHQSVKNLEPGIYVNDSKNGTSSNKHNPFFMLKEKNRSLNDGKCFGFNLVYSGNHKEVIEVNTYHRIRVQSGINSYCFEETLLENETFETPVAVLTFSSKGQNGVSQNMHHFTNNYIVRGKWANKERPVLLNNWEATYFNFNEAKILSLAKKAKEVGIELFVLDDGWFGDRNNDDRALGDWEVNLKKLPHDLKGLADKINKMGLMFGLWFEPEMISENSRCYEAHPEYAIKCPNRKPSLGRNQLVMDLTKVEVQDYIISFLTKILSSANIEYVKWDMNRNLTDIYDSSLNHGSFYHRYVKGLYRVLEEVTSKFPDILFESCSGGGNRTDLGMMCYMPQNWASDDTDGFERMLIQSGVSAAYPLSTIGAHVSTSPSHQLLRRTPIDTRFNVAMFGVLGYELDLGKLSKVEKQIVKDQIAFYKEHRRLLQYGTFYQLKSIYNNNQMIWMVLSEDKKEGIYGFYQAIASARPGIDVLRTVDVLNDELYHIEVRPQKIDIKTFGELLNRITPVNINSEGILVHAISRRMAMNSEKEVYDVYGNVLNAGGIRLKNQWAGTGWDQDTVRLLGDFGSRVYYFKVK